MKLTILVLLIMLCSVTTAVAEPEDAVFAIFKLSYNIAGETPVVGGICGTAFLINNKTALTAHHVLNKNTGPNPGFKHCRFWLIKRGKNKLVIPITNDLFKFFPEIETTVISLPALPQDIDIIELSPGNAAIDDEIFSVGHVGGVMPTMTAEWENNILVIHDYSLQENSKSDRKGTIVAKKLGVVNTKDVHLDNILMLQPSFGAIHGMSGGPLLDTNTNKIVGLMSFGLPADVPKKDIVFAVSINEIIRKLNRADIKF